MSSIPPDQRLADVRHNLSVQGVDGFVLPRGDEFLGEYVAPYAERLAWLTGFTGSAGLALVLPDKAAVFSDGRYTEQLAEQVDKALWEKRHITQEPPSAWLSANARDLRIGYDPRLIGESGLQALQGDGYEFVALTDNPVDIAWSDRPAPPASTVQFHPERLSGERSADKRARIAALLKENGEQALIVGDPTCLAWLLNIRADDVPNTPVALAFGILHDTGDAEIFIDETRLSDAAKADFGAHVTVYPADSLEDRLRGLAGRRVRLDPQGVSAWFVQTLNDAGSSISRGADPSVLLKASKNVVEQEGARQAHLTDSAALCRFLHFVTLHGVGLRETELAERLDRFRAEDADYRGESFPAISGVGPNAALPHYRALPGKDRVLGPDTIYLIDSGGQYPAGTTDVTRTIWTGPELPPSAVSEAFTRVLKGNIALSRARFPNGVTGHRLDVLARQSLWQAGLDYDHGTGHGIGSYLSVHEGPQNISAVARPVALQAGMIISNEPGYYEAGQYGIRLENLLLVRPASVGQSGRFLEFEVLGFAPFDRQLIDASLLLPDERAWLDSYHAETLRRIGPLLDPDTRAWLTTACAPLN